MDKLPSSAAILLRRAIFLLLLIPTCAIGMLVGRGQTWAFMQSVGGIMIGTPRYQKGSWSLPVECDVSGHTRVSTEPTRLNPETVWAGTMIEVEKDRIYLTIDTSAPPPGKANTACGLTNLGRLKPGRYSVIYRDPDGSQHPIRTIELKP